MAGGERPAAEATAEPAGGADVVLSPLAEFPPLSEEELALLRGIGAHWDGAAAPAGLPVDPTLGRYRHPPEPGRFGRLAPVRMFHPQRPGELVAAPPAAEDASRLGRWLTPVRRTVLGPPLSSAAVVYERMRKLVALPVLSSDLLSSVAYGPEAMFAVLVLGGTAALGLSLPIAAALIVLMIAIGVSYRQTIAAYPHGAGSYLVASDNLGPRSGLAAAAGLMMDYILTVSVSVAAAVHALVSLLPGLAPLTVPIGVLVILVLLGGNLRGVRSSGRLFALPTYLFLLALVALLAVGLARAGARGFTPLPPPPVPAAEGVGLLLVLRAFSSGAVSMTGVEAVSNAVPVFRRPEWRNARTTLTWMIAMLVVFFIGLVLLSHLNGIVPTADETMISQLARHVFPSGPWRGLILAATALILALAANTAFSDFPRLLFFVARDGYAPRRFLHMGDRLAFGNGLMAIAMPAAVIFVVFGGQTQKLVPLYAVGVFLAFTLSQTGMAVHWWRHRGRHWRKKLGINAFGAGLAGVVLLIAAVTKFGEGAWVVVLTVPLLMLLASRIRAHYDVVRQELALRPPAAGDAGPITVGPAAAPAADDGGGEAEELPQQVRHLVVVPVARLNLASLRALAYAASLRQPIFAVHLSPEEAEAQRFRQQWQVWGDHVRLETIVSPYRAIVAPLAQYLAALHAARPDLALTVILPEVIVRRRWHQLLHSRTEHRLRQALRELPGVVVTTVPVHLSR